LLGVNLEPNPRGRSLALPSYWTHVFGTYIRTFDLQQPSSAC